MRKFLSILICLTMILGLIPSAMAAGTTIIIQAGQFGYEEKGQWYGSQSLFGYNDVGTRYCTDAGSEAKWVPTVQIPGEYEVYFWKVVHQTNAEKATLEITSKDGTSSQEVTINSGESGFVSLGRFNFDAGTSGSVKLIHKTSGGFSRTSAVKFELVKASGDAVVPVYNVPKDDPSYPQNGNRTLQSKDVTVTDSKAGATKIYVKPGANGDGSEGAPFGSLEDAQNKVRELIKSGYPKDGISVLMMGGTYSLEDSLTFTNEDSGSADSPVIWKPYSNDKVTITTGFGLNSSDFQKVTDTNILNRLPDEAKNQVMEIDLRKAGVTSIDGTDFIKKTPYQLIVGDKAQTTAKWPNVGYGRTGTVADAASRSDSGPRKKGFTYDLNEPRSIRWETATDAWLSGFWLMEYTMDYSKVALVNSEKMTISGKDQTVWGSGGDARYYICNLLEEIDMPSEFFIDTKNLKLYYYPIQGWENQNLICATTNNPILVFESSSNVAFRDVVIEGAGSDGVIFRESSSNNMVAGGSIRNVSGVGASISGKGNGVRDCDIYYTGNKGVSLSGGNAKVLVDANNYVENCSIHDVGLTSTSKQAITFTGIGNRISNNHLYNIPHQAITGGLFANCIIENNIIERTNYELDDTAAIYINFAGFGYGTKIRSNLIIDSVGILEGEGGSAGGFVNGIYLDSGTCGVEMTDNVVINANCGIFNNFGRDLVVNDNIAINTISPIRLSTWGDPNSKGFVEGGELDSSIKTYYTDAFKEKFPNAHTATTMSDHPNEPKYNTIMNNIAVGNQPINVISQAYEGGKYENNQSFESLDGLNNILSDYNKIREFMGKTGGFVVGNYKGGLRTNTEAPIINNRVDEFDLITPANGVKNIDPNGVVLSWANDKGGIIGNTIYLSEDPDFKIVAKVENSTKTNVTLDLEYGKTYYWRVKANPKYGYEERWNRGGAGTFTTISVEDKLESLITLATEMLNNMDRSQEAKDKLKEATEAAKGAFNSKDELVLIHTIDDMKAKTKEYTDAVTVNTNDLSTLIYDDFTLDTEGQRPLGLFLRSYQPIDVTAVKLDSNMVVKYNDQLDSKSYGHRTFQNQNAYVEAGADVMAETTTGSFAVSLKQTDKDIVSTGVNSFIAAKVIFANDGYIYGDKNKSNKLMPYEANKWYKIKMLVDFTKKTYNVVIDGQVVGQGIAITDNVKSTNQLLIDSSDGTTGGALDKGVFYIDNVIVRAPNSTGRNSFLKGISVNGQPIEGFLADTYIYSVNLSKDELLSAKIEYNSPETAHVYVSKDSEKGKVYITVFSGDYQRNNVYTLKAQQ